MTSNDSLKTRVAAGANFLDERRPDWYRSVNLNTLSMRTEGWCVLAQVTGFNDYNKALQELGISKVEATDKYAFDIAASTYDAYEKVWNDLWEEEILSRRVPATAVPPMNALVTLSCNGTVFGDMTWTAALAVMNALGPDTYTIDTKDAQ